jgi:hypothetical protein
MKKSKKNSEEIIYFLHCFLFSSSFLTFYNLYLLFFTVFRVKKGVSKNKRSSEVCICSPRTSCIYCIPVAAAAAAKETLFLRTTNMGSSESVFSSFSSASRPVLLATKNGSLVLFKVWWAVLSEGNCKCQKIFGILIQMLTKH